MCTSVHQAKKTSHHEISPVKAQQAADISCLVIQFIPIVMRISNEKSKLNLFEWPEIEMPCPERCLILYI